MNQALYRKYRSRSFKEVVGQDHITQTLENAIKSGRISHAYLFTGPRGVGKTSVARILAHEANQLPYNSESIHLDIIEIDAASNRRIDEIRDLRERVRIAPTSAKYKIYIIDEVHMLTREAFNALLKTLEEPPSHCIFILATTEAHKLPETIISRTQRFEFKPINSQQAQKHLQQIAKKEKIDVSPEALQLLAEFGSGSFRDSIGYLDQLSSFGKTISESDVRQLLGLPSTQVVIQLLGALKERDAKKLIANLQHIKEQGVGAPELAAAISKQLRQHLIEGQAGPLEAKLLRQLIDVKANIRPYDYLEIILLEAVSENDPIINDRTDGSSGTPASNKSPKTDSKTKTASVKIQASPASFKSRPTSVSNFSLERWEELLEAAKTQAASIYTALRLAQPSLNGDKLVLEFQFPLHKKKLEQAKNKDLIANLIEKMSGDKLIIDCVVDKKIKPSATINDSVEEKPHGSLHSITNIFGAAEMIES